MAGPLSSTIWRSTGPGAISATEFLQKFQQSWTESRLTRTGMWSKGVPRRLGLAVSGGADSMALAYLCRQLELEKLVDGLSVTAFVVDHKAREESTREAKMVAGWLGDMDLTTKILELEWPEPDFLSKVSAFETHARRLRFQALGTACRDASIQTLLMGHHQDDNVETTLWRLCSGARGAGLTGIPQVARIPECHGLYGVSESGLCSVLRAKSGEESRLRIRIGQRNEARIYFSPHGERKPSVATPALEATATARDRDAITSTGGILICRPLLSFPKTRLLATCSENSIPFVNDPTNFDPTLTPRNAIRHLLSSKKLPQALQPPSILSLIKRSQDLMKESTELSDELLKACRVWEFNSRAGWIVVSFPSSGNQTMLPDTSSHHSMGEEKISQHQIQALTLRRITELLSPFPENHFPLRSFEKSAERIFSSDSHQHRQPFTLGGVIFRPIKEELSNPTPHNNHSHPNHHTSGANTYLLSRQPYMRHRFPTLHFDLPIQISDPKTGSLKPTHTDWALWDDRYWIRLKLTPSKYEEEHKKNSASPHSPQHPSITRFTIRPLQPPDLPKIYRFLDDVEYETTITATTREDRDRLLSSEELQERLSREAPGPIRFTMPLLTVEEPGLDEQPLALLTLSTKGGPAGVETVLPHSGSWKVEWEWIYKMIDPEPLKLMDWLEDERPPTESTSSGLDL